MADLDVEIARADGRLSELDAAREETLALCRSLGRAAAQGIVSVHGGGEPDLEAMRKMVERLHEFRDRAPSVYHQGHVVQALQEYAELRLLLGFKSTGGFPSIDDVGVEPEAYLLGLADCVGEMRRMCLDMLIAGKRREAMEVFRAMERVSDALAHVHYASSLIPIRKKKDAVRAIVERTHGEMLHGGVPRELEE